MKLTAPPGVGDPCVAGVAIPARDGVYEVEAEIGALLRECFGFVEVEAGASEKLKVGAAARSRKASGPTRPKGPKTPAA